MSSLGLTDTTAPHSSSPTMNCSPRIARSWTQYRSIYTKLYIDTVIFTKFSQQREAMPFLSRIIHFPPSLLASSYSATHHQTHINTHTNQQPYLPPTWA